MLSPSALAFATFLPALVRRALSKAGHFTGFLWVRPMKTRKGVTDTVTKTVRCVGRVGLAYDNRAAVQDARESGELPATNAGLPWGEWFAVNGESFFPYLITHKGNLYLRIYPVPGRAPKVIYKLNGRIVSKAEIAHLCLASEFSEVKEDIGCMTLGVNALRLVR